MINEIEKLLKIIIIKLEKNLKEIKLEELEDDLSKLKNLLERYYAENFMELLKHGIISKKFGEINSILNNIYEIIEFMKSSNNKSMDLLHKIIYKLKLMDFKIKELKRFQSMLNVI